MHNRKNLMYKWLDTISIKIDSINPIKSDASFRCYFRILHINGTSSIAMDAPPGKEDCKKFINIANALKKIGVNTPTIIAYNLEHGFLLITDLGEKQYLDVLNKSNVHNLYDDALNVILKIQKMGNNKLLKLPIYDNLLLYSELELFRQWFLNKQVKIRLSSKDNQLLDSIFVKLIENAISQPYVWVHRDFHSKNIMLCNNNNPGILDFQDAMVGAITYDLVSLLRDCYISWPQEEVSYWTSSYFKLLVKMNFLSSNDYKIFLRWFDLMGIQRHLKAIGIFSRLNLRDFKPEYLKNITRTLKYVISVSDNYIDLKPLNKILINYGLEKWENF